MLQTPSYSYNLASKLSLQSNQVQGSKWRSMPAVVSTYTWNIYLNPTKRLMVLKLITGSTKGFLSTKRNLGPKQMQPEFRQTGCWFRSSQWVRKWLPQITVLLAIPTQHCSGLHIHNCDIHWWCTLWWNRHTLVNRCMSQLHTHSYCRMLSTSSLTSNTDFSTDFKKHPSTWHTSRYIINIAKLRWWFEQWVRQVNENPRGNKGLLS
jgi:hypothetical protein